MSDLPPVAASDASWQAFGDWLDGWFQKELTYDNTAYRSDDEWSAVLISDLAAAGFVVLREQGAASDRAGEQS